MSSEPSDQLEQLLVVERELQVLLARTSDLERQFPALEQGLAKLWMLPDQNRCTTTLRGRVTGISLQPIVGTTIKITGHQSGADYGTFTFDGVEDPDYWTAEIHLLDADTSVDLVVRGPGPRFQDTTPAEMSIFNRCGENTYRNPSEEDYIVCNPATDYYYPFGNSQYNCPLYKTLNFTDEILGTGVLTHGGPTPGYWGTSCYELPTRAYTIPGFISCPSVNSVCSMRLNYQGSPQFCGYQGPYCPLAADCSSASPLPVITWGTPQVGATTWPGPFTPYDVTYNLPGISERTYHDNRTYVLRIWES